MGRTRYLLKLNLTQVSLPLIMRMFTPRNRWGVGEYATL